MVRIFGLGRLFFGLTLGIFWFITPQTALAQTDVETGYRSILNNGIIFANLPEPQEACKEFGQCTLDQVMQIFVNIATGILGVIGSIVLLMFVYGGYVWITSFGREERVTRGKDTMNHAILGLALVLGAYALMNFVIASVAGDRPSATLEETIQKAQDAESSL